MSVGEKYPLFQNGMVVHFFKGQNVLSGQTVYKDMNIPLYNIICTFPVLFKYHWTAPSEHC